MKHLKLYLGIAFAIFLIFAVIVLGVIGYVSLYFSILSSIAIVFTAQLLRESYLEKNLSDLVGASKAILVEELIRNFCIAELFEGSLLSTTAWDNVVASGITLRMKNSEFRSLMRCYSAIEFYNHDVSWRNTGVEKQKRVKKFISDALSVIDSEPPSIEKCCKEILPEWATKDKLDKACNDRLRQNKTDTTTK